MRIALPIFVALGVRAYDGTTIFDTILLAHPEPTYCPSPTVGHVFTPDANYAVCCYDGFPSVTQTTATGPGGKKIYACCMDGYSCTGAAPVMSDWSIDKAGDVQYTAVTSAPVPNSAPAITTQAPSPSLDTVSSPGATPYTTSAGTVYYVNNINSNNINGDGNNNNNSNVKTGSGSLSGGAIAGITVACTIISTIVGVLGLWYARKRKRARESDDGPYAPPSLPQDDPTPMQDANSAPWPTSPSSPMAQQHASSNVPQEMDWNPAHPHPAELDWSGRSEY